MKKVIKVAALVAAAALAGMAALFIVYLLPTERMRSHVESSIDIFYIEETYPQQVAGYKLSQLDNETDAIMLLNAIYPGNEETALKKAMGVPRLSFDDDYSGRSELVSWLWLKKEPDSTSRYARYWHGYLLFLKPLLLIMDYADIRILNMIVQLFLFSFLIVSMAEKGYKKYIIPLLAAEAVINPAAVAMSLQFSSVFYIVILSLIYICRQETDRLMSKDYLIFTLLGIMTAFFDFLTYPMATLGMAVVFLLIRNPSENDWKKTIGLIVKWCFFWGLGYAGMWSAKWLIASVILQDNIIGGEVMRQASAHTSDVIIMDVHYNPLQVVWKNIAVLAKWPYLLLAVGVILLGIKNRMKLEVRRWKQIIPFLIIALSPMVWLMLLKNHSGWLYWYTYRGLMVTVFAVLCGIVKLSEE